MGTWYSVALVWYAIVSFAMDFFVAYLWECRGHTYRGGFWCSFFFSPIVGLLACMCLKDLSSAEPSSTTRRVASAPGQPRVRLDDIDPVQFVEP